MKILSVIMLVTLLASCTGTKVETDEKIMETTATQETVADMNESMTDLDNMQLDESKVQLIKYTYANPAQEVNMDIEYSLDSEGKISMINITSDNYNGLTGFNEAAQEVILGLTLEQASEVELISGASLTTQAFKEAIKTQL